jgi:LysR family transcriptional regulator of gallate degradation
MAAIRTPDPKRLLDLLAIAEHGSYTHAATALGVSQPALSNSIAALEKALGVRVLDRTRSGATLTDFGRLLAGHAEALRSALSRASGDVALKKDGMEGSLVVGVSPVACVDIVPDAVALLKGATPNVSVRIHELPDDQLLAQLRTGEIDLMVSPTGFIADLPEIEREVLLRDTFVVIMRPQNPLAKRKTLSLRELRHAQWVMPNLHTTMWRQIEALFAAGNEPWPAACVSTNSVTALKSLVMRSDSVSISSTRLVKLECEAGYLKGVALRDAHFSREICLRRRKNLGLTPLTQRFVEILRRVAADDPGERVSPKRNRPGQSHMARRRR